MLKIMLITTLLCGINLHIALGEEAHGDHHVEVGVEPEKALGWMKNGNIRFLKGKFRRDGQNHKDIIRLSTGQKPHSIVLSCSDSRVPPEVIFDQKLGEIFVVRTAGETLDSSAIASIEYAVSHLGSREIIVLGHTACGAVKAALSTIGGGDAGSPNLNKLVADIHPRIKGMSEKTASKNVERETLANAKGVADDLVIRSDIIREMVKRGEVQINVGIYYLDTGRVIWE